MSLVEVMIGLSLVMVSLVAITSLQVSQQRENRALSEKLGAMDLTRIVAATVASNCNGLLEGSNVVNGPLQFSPGAVSPAAPRVFNLRNVPGTAAGVPPVAVAGTEASTYTNSLRILPEAQGGIQLQVTGPTTGNLLVNFDQNQLVRGIRNVSIGLTLQAPGGTIQTCMSTATASPSGAGEACTSPGLQGGIGVTMYVGGAGWGSWGQGAIPAGARYCCGVQCEYGITGDPGTCAPSVRCEPL